MLIYNPPHCNKLQFLSSLESLLALVSRDNTDFIVLGDLNIDLLVETTPKLKLLNLANSVSLTQCISEPTRVTLTTKTLLDPIFVSFPLYVNQNGVFSLTTSDHRFTYVSKNCKLAKSPSKIIEFRSYKNFNPTEIGEKLKLYDWNQLTDLPNVNLQLNFIESKILELLNNYCPLQKRELELTQQNGWTATFWT